MNKYKETFGIDISKDVFDVYGSKSGHNQFKNNPQGFKDFSKILPSNALVPPAAGILAASYIINKIIK